MKVNKLQHNKKATKNNGSFLPLFSKANQFFEVNEIFQIEFDNEEQLDFICNNIIGFFKK